MPHASARAGGERAEEEERDTWQEEREVWGLSEQWCLFDEHARSIFFSAIE